MTMTTRSLRLLGAGGLSLVLFMAMILGLSLIPAGEADAFNTPDGTLLITYTGDDSYSGDGICSLREAIVNANQNSQASSDCPAGTANDVIVLQSGAVYTLAQFSFPDDDAGWIGDLDITDSLTIRSQGNGPATIERGDPAFLERAIHIMAPAVTISQVRISGFETDEIGAGIYNNGTLRLYESEIAGNRTSDSGGGIHNTGSGELWIYDSVITGNHTDDYGGGIEALGPVHLWRTTVASNSYGVTGGGLHLNQTEASLVNVTISSNRASSPSGPVGGGIYIYGGELTVTHTTVADNMAPTGPAGLAVEGGAVVTLAATIMANDGGNCGFGLGSGTIYNGGYSWANDLTCGVASGTLTLGPLADNGGKTPTHALLGPGTDNDALDAVPSGNCELSVDQRGVSRPQNGGQGNGCDAGAYEYDSLVTLALIKTVNQDRPFPGSVVVWNLSVRNTGPNTATNVIISDTLPSALTPKLPAANVPYNYNSSENRLDLTLAEIPPYGSVSALMSTTLDSNVTVEVAITNTAEIYTLTEINDLYPQSTRLDRAVITPQKAIPVHLPVMLRGD